MAAGARDPWTRRVRAWLPGLLLVGLLALAAFGLALAARPFLRLEASLAALLLGLAAGAILRHPAPVEPGAQLAMKKALTLGVVLLGAEVNLAFLLEVGPRALVLALVLVPLTLGVFLLLARLLRVEDDTWALLGTGTAICGLSAVLAAGATLRSRERDVAIAAASVAILSAVGLVLYPLLDLLARMPEHVYGAWSGLSLHAVANAVAAGVARGDEAGRVAALTKTARVALLAPVLVGLALLLRRGRKAEASRTTLLPPMVWGFLALSLLVSLVPVPDALLDAAKVATRALLLVGMAGLGYTTRLGDVRKAGPRALTLAVVGWVVLSAAALAGAWLLYG